MRATNATVLIYEHVLNANDTVVDTVVIVKDPTLEFTKEK